LPMILITNAAYKAYDFDHVQPASLSAQVVTGLLRTKLGYRGLALAYDLESPEVRGGPDFGEAVINAMSAGCDLLVVNQENSIEVGRRALETALETGKLLPQRIEEAMRRIRAGRKGLRRPSGTLAVRSFDRLAREFEEFNSRVKAGGEIEN
jgi:beta-glucosidase-like glycosyl hydrolase